MPDLLAPPQPDRKHFRSSTLLTMRGATETQELPAGVCGQVEGIAMVYGVVDTYGTTFLKGCLDRTIRERVAARKVKLYFDHGDAPLSGMYDTHLHIGTVVDVWDDTTEDGLACSRFRADIFDTAPGRTAHEYLTAIAQTRSETGVSVGLLTEPKMARAVVAGFACDQIVEAALREISVTGESSVPGTKVTWVRQEAAAAPIDPATLTLSTSVNYLVLLDGIIAHLGVDTVRAHLSATVSDTERQDRDVADGAPVDATTDAPASGSPGVPQGGTEPPLPNVVSMTERLAWCRTELPRLYQ